MGICNTPGHARIRTTCGIQLGSSSNNSRILPSIPSWLCACLTAIYSRTPETLPDMRPMRPIQPHLPLITLRLQPPGTIWSRTVVPWRLLPLPPPLDSNPVIGFIRTGQPPSVWPLIRKLVPLHLSHPITARSCCSLSSSSSTITIFNSIRTPRRTPDRRPIAARHHRRKAEIHPFRKWRAEAARWPTASTRPFWICEWRSPELKMRRRRLQRHESQSETHWYGNGFLSDATIENGC